MDPISESVYAPLSVTVKTQDLIFNTNLNKLIIYSYDRQIEFELNREEHKTANDILDSLSPEFIRKQCQAKVYRPGFDN